MQREEKMKGSRICKIISLVLVFAIVNSAYAANDYVGEYFDGISPSSHLYGAYSNKDTLPNDRIEYADIEAYVHNFNPDILNSWNDWENNKSANDVYDDYVEAADRLYDSAGSSDSDLQAGIATAQADAMMIQADKNVDDSYVSFLSKYLEEKKLILATKILDINYQKSIYDELNAKNQYEEALRKEQSANNALLYGSGTNVDVLTAKKNAVDAKSSIVTAESATKTYKRNLIINCGKSYDADIFIAPFDLEENFDVNSIDRDADYKYALEHNIQYEIYKRKRNNARTNEVQKEYDILIEAAPQNIYNDLDTKYSNLLDLLETKYNREVAYNLAVSNFMKAQNEFSSGAISEKEYKTYESNVNTTLYNLTQVKYDFKIALEEYRASAMGYGNS